MFFVYILRSKYDKLYIGQTNCVNKRYDYHKWGVASKFTSQNIGPFDVVYTEKFPTRAEAMVRERQLKGWTRSKKEALIAHDLTLLKKL